MTATTHRFFCFLRARTALLSAMLLVPALLYGQATTFRTISGTVTDRGGEPLKGAVVELENQDSHTVISFLTDAGGHYVFKRVDSNTDFVVAVKYRDHHSKPKPVSKFNSHMQTVLNFHVKLY